MIPQFLFLVANIFNSQTASAANTITQVLLPAAHVYSPAGFDDNDDSQVIIRGYLPNLCYKSPKAEAVVNGHVINIKLTAFKNTDPHIMCAQARVPFLEVLSVGMLERGDYQLKVNENTPYESTGLLNVVSARSNNIDDYIYADINQVDHRPGNRHVRLKGYNVSNCFVPDEVKILFNGKDSFSILPIMKQVKNFCPKKLTPIKFEVDLPNVPLPDEVLLHVRIVNGKSFNTIFQSKAFP